MWRQDFHYSEKPCIRSQRCQRSSETRWAEFSRKKKLMREELTSLVSWWKSMSFSLKEKTFSSVLLLKLVFEMLLQCSYYLACSHVTRLMLIIPIDCCDLCWGEESPFSCSPSTGSLATCSLFIYLLLVCSLQQISLPARWLKWFAYFVIYLLSQIWCKSKYLMKF